jgi:hypothetical protein
MSNRDADDDYDRTMDDDRAVDDDYDDEYDPNPSESGKWISAVIALLGLWMIVEALLFDIVVSQFWNDIIVGALVVLHGAYSAYEARDTDVATPAAGT